MSARISIVALATRYIAGAFPSRKYDAIAHEFGTTGDTLKVTVCRLRKKMVAWDRRSTVPAPEMHFATKFTGNRIALTSHADWGSYPCAVIPCRNQKQARALMRQHGRKSS